MALRLEQRKPLTNVTGTMSTPGHGPKDDLDARVAYGLVHAPSQSVKYAGVTLRELRLTEVEDGWRLMVKGDRAGRPVVSYFYAGTYRDAVNFAMTSIDLSGAVWRQDKYPPTRLIHPVPDLSF